MTKPPAFQFYADDFLAGTMHFTDAEVGLYMRLLCVQWNAGKLPNENHELSSYGKGATPIERVKSKFELCEDGFLRNKRLETERNKQEIYRKSRSDNGKQGGRPQKPHAFHTVLKTKAQKSSPSPSPIAERESQQDFPECNGHPTIEEVKAMASMMGLAEWKAVDWFNEMAGCGWLDHHKRPVHDARAVLARVKTKWEADGRPKSPPRSAGYKGANPSTRSSSQNPNQF